MIKPSKTIFRNSIFSFAAQMVIKVFSFIFSIHIIRYLGAESFGQYSAIMAFVGTFAIFSDLGLSLYTTRQVARYRDDPEGAQKSSELYTNIFFFRLVLAVLSVLLITAFAYFTNRPLVMILGVAFNSLLLVLYAIQGSSEAVLGGFERLDISSSSKVLNQVVFVSVGALLLWLGAGYFGLITANLLAVSSMLIVCWLAVKSLGVKLGRPSPGTWLKLLRFSIPFGIVGFALGLSYKFDTVLLNIFRSDQETGYYNAAYNLIFSLVIFSNAINTSLYPTLSRISVNAPEKLHSMYNRSFRYLMFISLPIAVGITILADQFVQILYTQDYIPSIIALRILIWVLPFMYASEFLGYTIVIANKESLVARAVVISTSLNILLNLILVPRFGYIAASAMTVLTEMVLVGQYVWFLRKHEKDFVYYRSILSTAISAIMMGAIVFILRMKVNLFVNVLIGAASYIIFSSIMGVIGREELRFVKQFFVPQKKETLL